jgi:hypothetical protein
MREPEKQRQSAAYLAALLLRDRAGNNGTRLEAHYRALLSHTIWMWTEAAGKYRGCRYWTPAALEIRRERRRLRHEHIVPRKDLIEALHKLADPTPDAVRDLYSRMAMACIVTVAEHDRLLDATWEELSQDPWIRYRRAGLEWIDTSAP